MKLGQLIKCNNRKIFVKNYAENEEWRLVPDFFVFFKNAEHEIKATGMQLSFNIALNLGYNKNKL